MGFKTGAYCTCFGVEPGRGNFTKVRLSVSKKDRQSGMYVQDFGDYCMFIGEAHKKAALLSERARIRLGDVDVSSTYDKASGRKYVDFKVFDFELVDQGKAPAPVHRPATNPSEPAAEEGDDDSLPF